MANCNNYVYIIIILCMNVCALDSKKTYKRIEIKVIRPKQTADECDIAPLLQQSVGSAARCNITPGKYVEGSFAKNHTLCQVSKNETVFQYQCVEGTWKLTTGTDIHNRNKRFLGDFFGSIGDFFEDVVTVVACVFEHGKLKCEDKQVEAKTLTPPSYTTCPPADIKSVYTAGKKQKTVKVTWTDPTATDDKELLSNQQTCCDYTKGAEFPGLPNAGYQHNIIYTATDNHKQMATCNFNFVVKYLTCSEPDIPANGKKVLCPDDYLYDGECTFECNTGYEMVGNSSATCQQNQTWTQTPLCQKVVCDAPFDISNGKVLCNNLSYPYNDDCLFECNDGFELNGPRKMICKADKTWSMDASQISCNDDDPPVIECHKYAQVFYADRGLFSTFVMWEEPTATDNVDPKPNVVQTSGPSQGQILSEGIHAVEYKATDSDGNSHPALSECTILIEVKVIRCSTGPTDALDEPRFMMYNCSDTSFYNGVVCYLDCDLNLPLNGTDYITCEHDGNTGKGVWNWGSGYQPVCEVVECPALDPPGNGAFTTDSVNAIPLHVMFCQKGYDISSVGSDFQGRLSCQDSGEWYPLDRFPDCIVSIFPWLNLPAELYYEGNCNDEATKDEIKQKMLEYLDGVQAVVDKSICPDVNTCKVDNVVVVCGDTRKRRSLEELIIHKRNTGFAAVSFDIKVLFEQGNKTSQDAYIGFLDVLNNIRDDIQVDVNNGELDLFSSLSLSASDGFITADNPNFLCDSGYKIETGSVSCKPCPPGTYLDSGTGNCEYCGIGKYMDHEGETECDACPESHSTLSSGAKDLNKCIKLCSQGHYSSSSMEPCSACDVGSFQPQEGQIECLVCPPGTATNKIGSTSSDYCDFFDISVETLPQRTEIGSFSAGETTVISASVWLKQHKNVNSDVSIFVADSVGDILYLSISNTTFIQAGTSNAMQTNNALSWNHWTHIMSTVDLTSGSLKLYVDGTLVIDETGVSVVPARSITDGSVHILSDFKGMHISGLVLYGRNLSDVDITALSQTCAVASNDEIFSMTNILSNLMEGIAVITPTSCDPIDECADDPCGDHTCINMVNNFQCICHGEMTGELCTFPPDYCFDNECVMGTCVPGNGTYTCTCNGGYSGSFCDTPPVDGGWSQWVEWNGCDVTCGGGTQSRHRNCNNPLPGFMGNDCEGDKTESEVCNQQTCPTCKNLRRKIGTVITCPEIESENLKKCYMTCINGKTLPDGQKPFEYTCGQSTNYKWQPIDMTPECVDVIRPDIFGTQASVTYTDQISGSDQSDLITGVEQQFSDVGCVKTGLCEVMSSVSDLSRKRRSSSSTLTVLFSIRLTDTGDLALGDYLSNGTETSAMAEFLDALNAVNEVIEFIQYNTVSIFQVTVNGVEYTLESDTANVVATVTCPSGHAGADGLCAQCAAGTRLEDTMCIDCETGTYQPLTGQSTCLSCPSGFTTPTYGASDVSECSVEITVDDSNDSGDNDNDDENGNNDTSEGNSKTVLIVVPVVCSVFLVLVGIIGLLVLKKCLRRRFRRNERNGSFASLSMIRSASSCSGVNENSQRAFDKDKLKGISLPDIPIPHIYPMYEGAFQEKPPSYASVMDFNR